VIRRIRPLLACAFVVAACSSSSSAPSSPAATTKFDAAARFDAPGAFFDFPYPSDLRLTAQGTPDVAGFPDPGVPVLPGLKAAASERQGFPVVPVGYFRFTAKLAPRDPEVTIADGANAPILLVDVDPASPERGKTFPVVAGTPNPDPYVPEFLLAIAARPGIVLAPHRKYAFVVTRKVGLEAGGDASPPDALAALAKDGPGADPIHALYAPLWETLDTIAVPRTDVVGATVFTTGDVVADTAALGDRVLAKYKPALEGFTYAPDTTGTLGTMCHVRATITLPQFQKGQPLYSTEGLFEMGPDGVPVEQRQEKIPVSIAIPRQAMPAAGYPLVIYFHGSGGTSSQFVDGGIPAEPDPHWPGPILAGHGFAVAGSALPISPERVPGAQDIDYINVNNVVATRDTFRQGVIESRLLIDALGRAEIPASVLTGCAGPTLPQGATGFRFDITNVHAQGQSMGGMYTNLVSAVEPRIKLSVPTGAGGYWTYFLLHTTKIPGAAGLVALLLKTPEPLTFVHPAMHLIETALEPIDPMVSMPRLAKRPLDGHPVRPIYEPVGKDDSYFPTVVYDAMVLAYGHPRAGDEVWPSMGEAMSLIGTQTPVPYPVKLDATSIGGKPYTGVVVQSPGDGVHDSHGIYRRVDGIIHQYECFHTTFRDDGVATVPAPAAIGAPCE
jgi:hypothetical protein